MVIGLWGRMAATVFAAALVAGTAEAEGRFSAERLVKMEGLGNVRVSPDGRWVAVERQGAYNTATTYAYGSMTSALLSDLLIIDTAGQTPDRTLGADDAQGYQSGPPSPDGRQMVVYRLSDHSRSLGVLELETGDVRWFDVGPQLAVFGRALAWADRQTLVVSATPDGDLPLYYRLGWQAQARTAELWREALTGAAPTATYVPSGPDRDSRPKLGGERLVRLSLQDGSVRTLLAGEIADFELSPDGQTAAVLTNEEDLQPQAGVPVVLGAATRRRRLRLVDVRTGRIADPAPDQDILAHLLTWSEGGKALLVYGREPGRPWEEGGFLQLARDGAAMRLDLANDRPAIDASPGDGTPIAQGVWSGQRPLLLAVKPDGTRTWRTPGSNAGPGLPDASNIRFQSAATGLWLATDGGWSHVGSNKPFQGRWVGATVTSDVGSRAFWNPASSGLEPRAFVADGCLSPAPDVAPAFCPPAAAVGETLIAASENARTAVYRATGDHGESDIRITSGTGATRRVASVNQDLTTLTWPELREIPAGPDGEPAKSWLLVPPGAPPAEGWPVIVSIYPGRTYSAAPGWLKPGVFIGQMNPQVLASAGYAVLVPDLALEGRGDLSSGLSERIEGSLNTAARAAPLDTRRVALMGHSFGGYAALLVASQTDRFRAVVASAAASDLGSSLRDTVHATVLPQDGIWLTGSAGWLETGQGAMGAPPWEAPEAYIAASPLYRADRIRTPTLLVRGDLDPVGAESMFGALYRLNRDAALLTYWGEGHNLASPANILDLHVRVLDFLSARMSTLDVGKASPVQAASVHMP